MRNFLIIALSGILVSCGESPVLTIDVDLAVNPTTEGNPLKKIEADRIAGTSLGIYFRFTPLRCPPGSIENTAGTPIQFPPVNPDGSTQPGFKATENEFNIDTTLLKTFTYYKVEMFSQDAFGNVPYKGVSDCPVNLSLNPQVPVTICFGEATTTPLCPGVTPFSLCTTTAEFCH